MNENQADKNESSGQPQRRVSDEVMPDELMSDFRGKSLGKIVIFTVLVHAIFIGVFSVGALFHEELTEAQRMERAVDDGIKALQDIADRYEGVEVSDLASRLAAGKVPIAATGNQVPPATGGDGEAPTEPSTSSDGDGSVSDYEKTIQIKQEAPDVPDLNPDNEDDLFAPETP